MDGFPRCFIVFIFVLCYVTMNKSFGLTVTNWLYLLNLTILFFKWKDYCVQVLLPFKICYSKLFYVAFFIWCTSLKMML